MKKNIKRSISILLSLVILTVFLPFNQVYAWSLKTNNYSANLILNEIISSNGKVNISPYGEFSVDPEFYSAIKKYPNAFKAGSLGADSYPDIYVGQGYLQAGDKLTSGQWLKRMIEDALSLPEESEKRYEITSFMLGFMNYYSQEMFGNTFTNQVANGEYPSFAELIDQNTAVGAAQRLTKYIATEKYIDSKIPDSYSSGSYIQIDAPNDFLLDSLLFNGSKDRGISDKYRNDPPYHYKYLIELRLFVKEKADYFRAYGNASNVFDYAANTVISGYLDAWLEDIDAAIDEWINVSERIAKEMLKSGNSTDFTVAIDQIMNWVDTHGKYITPVPDVLIDAMNLKGDIVKYFKDELGITALQNLYDQFEAYVQELILDFFLYNVMGLSSNQIDQMKNAFKFPVLVLGDKNIEQLDQDLGNFGTNHDVDNQEFTPFYNALTMTKLILIGPDGYKSLINKVKSISNTGYNKSTGEAMIDNLKVGIKTEDPFGPDTAGTDNDVYFGVKFTDGTTTKTLCDKSGYNDFESGDYDTYDVPLNRKVKISQIDKFFLQKKDVIISDDWNPEYFKATAYLGNIEIKEFDKVGLGTYKNETPKYYSCDEVGKTYVSSLNSGILEYITSLQKSMSWKSSSFKLWSDLELREDIFYSIFKDIEKYDNPSFDPFVYIDVLPPELDDVTLSPSDWYSGDVEVTFNVIDSFSGVSEVRYAWGSMDISYFNEDDDGVVINQYSLTATQNGTFTIYAVDKEDNGAVYEIDITNIDKEDPILSSVVINNGDEYTNTNNVVIEIESTDQISGVQFMEVSNTSDFSDSQVIPYQESYNHQLENTSGDKRVYVKVYDKAMNESEVMTDDIMLDIEYPDVELDIAGSHTYSNESKRILVNVIEKYSGVNKVFYKKGVRDEGELLNLPANVTEINPKEHFDVYTNDDYSVYVEDRAGNITADTIEMNRIDRIKPSIGYASFNYDFMPTSDLVEIDVFTKDERSGVGLVEYSLDNETFLEVSNPISIDSEMNGPIYIRAYDNANNVNLISTRDIIIDKTPPTYEYEILSDDEYVNDSVRLVLKASDESGIQSIELEGGEKIYNETASFILEDSEYRTYTITDKAGNETKAKISVDGIDKEPPTSPSINVLPQTFDGENKKVEGYVVEIVSGVDLKSGTQKSMYSINSKTDFVKYNNSIIFDEIGEYTIYAKSIDAARNESDVSIVQFEVKESKVIIKEENESFLNELLSNEQLDKETTKEIEELIKEYLEKSDATSIDVASNKRSGEITIAFSDDITLLKDKINQTIKNKYSKANQINENDLYINLKVIDFSKKSLVYSANKLEGVQTLKIENLKDDTEYLVEINIVFSNKIIATRKIRRKTLDKTPPVIKKMTMKNGVLYIEAEDSSGLSELPFKFIVHKKETSSLDGLFDVNRFMSESETESDNWSDEASLSGLEVGDRVIVMIRDNAGNETYQEIRIVMIDGNLYENLNADDPLEIEVGKTISKESIIDQAIKKHNINESDNMDIENIDYNNFNLYTEDDSIEIMDNSIKAIDIGEALLIIEDTNNKVKYVFFIEIEDFTLSKRNKKIEVGSVLDLKEAFSKLIISEFANEDEVSFEVESGIGIINESKITSTKEGINKIKVSNGENQIYVYVTFVDEPIGEVVFGDTNISYTIKKGEIIDPNKVLLQYDESGDIVDNLQLICESSNKEVAKILDDGMVKVLSDGQTQINIYSPLTNVEVKATLTVENLDPRNYVEYEDVELKSWAYSSIKELNELRILKNDEEFKPKDEIDWDEFLDMLNKVILVTSKNIYNSRNDLRNKLAEDVNNYYDKLNVFSYLTSDDYEYLFKDGIDLTKKVTRKDTAYIIAAIFEYQSKNQGIDFIDIKDNDEYYEAISAVVANGIFKGYPDKEFKKDVLLNKEQMATVLARIIWNEK